MHTSCLGVCGYIMGSVLQELILFNGSNTPKENLKDFWGLLATKYSDDGVTNRLTSLTLPMLGALNKPCLHAKAAETQALLGPVSSICRDTHDGSDHDSHRLLVLESLHDLYRLLKAAPMFLDEEQWVRALALVDTVLLHNNALLHSSIQDGYILYPVHFKHHLLWHIVYSARWLNPTACWCYQWEDFMGKLVLSAKNCVAGTPMTMVASKVLENFLLALNLELCK